MIEFLTEYGMFVAKLATLLILIVLALRAIVAMFMHAAKMGEEHLEIKKLNDKYENMSLALSSATLPKKAFKKWLKDRKCQQNKDRKKSTDDARKRIYVIRFEGDVRASEVSSLRESITAVLTVAKPSDEVVILLESSGGIVHGYGLAASQLERIRNRGVKLTVAVDKVAASGGYMMACVADHIIAAPFAVLGSIGVVGQLPNFYKFLKKHDIDFEQITAGEYKRTLTLFGENTEKDRQKFQEDIDDAHQLFKEFVVEKRPSVDIESISTGEIWYGRRAMQLELVDELRTSDDYLYDAAEKSDLFLVRYIAKEGLKERLFSFAESLLTKS